MRKPKRFIFMLSLAVLSLTVLIWIGCQKEPQGVIAPADETSQDMGLSKAVRNIQTVMTVQDRHTDALLAKKNVVGTATTMLPDGRYAIKILVKDEAALPQLPHDIENLPVVVDVVGEIRALAVYTDKYRPVKGGVSGGSYEYYRENQFGYIYDGGTIGCVVKKSGKKYFLSNNHVFAHSNKEKIGTPVVQPGLIDVGGVKNPDDIVGHLSDFKKIKWGPLRNSNIIDAAIAKIAPGVDYDSDMICGFTPSKIPVEATIGMRVKKCGRTTGLTLGEVTAVNVIIVVNYMPDGYARFENQVEYTGDDGPMTGSGDSGSLIVTQSGNNPIALTFAGGGDYSYGNPIQAVLDYFGVTICGN